jgi:phosphoribosylglycinamide formyltransferase-1
LSAPVTTSFANLIVDLDDPRFGQQPVHHSLEALAAHGITPLREHHTPERILGWIDAEFGGTWSGEAAAGGIWIASGTAGPIGFAAYDPRGLRFGWLRAWAAREAVGIFGPLGVVPASRGGGLGTVLARAALFSLRERGYRQALVPVVKAELIPFYERAAGARVVETVRLAPVKRARTVVLASGNGSNFGAVAADAAAGKMPLEIVGLVVNRAQAYARERAREFGIPADAVEWDRSAQTRAAYDARVIEAVAAYEPDLVLLLGWMHVLPAAFVARFPELLNIHPAFLPLDPNAESVTMPDFTELPAFRGPRAFDEALAAGVRWAGATMHRVGVAVDRGIVVAREPFALDRTRSRHELDEQLHAAERRVMRTALRRWTWEWS